MRRKPYTLVGCDGNAFAVMGYIAKMLKENGHSRDEIKSYEDAVQSSDYNNLLATSMDMIEMVNNELGFEEGSQFDFDLEDIDEAVKFNRKLKHSIDERYDNYIPREKQIENVLNQALQNAAITLWDEYGYNFTKQEIKDYIVRVAEKFDPNKLSIARVMRDE